MTDTTTATTTEKVPADAPGYPLGGPEPKSRIRLLAEQELANEAATAEERAEIDAAKAEIKAEQAAAQQPAAGSTDPLS